MTGGREFRLLFLCLKTCWSTGIFFAVDIGSGSSVNSRYPKGKGQHKMIKNVLICIFLVTFLSFIFFLHYQKLDSLQDHIGELESRVSSLDSEKSDLESRIDDLEHRLNNR